jgi:predicted alpha/beta-hydrolase family hydrolase
MAVPDSPVRESLKLITPVGVVSAEWLIPENPRAVLVFAHGAGAGYKHENMESIASHCAGIGLAVLRFNFPYMEARKRRVDRQEISVATIVAAAKLASAKGLPLFLGGHSYGGRMSSHAALEKDLPEIVGLVFCSFPLHQPKKPSLSRAEHMDKINAPMVFVSGSRDDMAEPELMKGLVCRLNVEAQVCWLQTANHGYRVLKRTRTLESDVFTELAGYVDNFVRRCLADNVT